MKRRLKVLSFILSLTIAISGTMPTVYAARDSDALVSETSTDSATSSAAIVSDDTTTSVATTVKTADSTNIEAYATTDEIIYGDYNKDDVFNKYDLSNSEDPDNYPPGLLQWLNANKENSETIWMNRSDDERAYDAINVCGFYDFDNSVESGIQRYRMDYDEVEASYKWLSAKLNNNRTLPCDVGEPYRWGDANGDGKVQQEDLDLVDKASRNSTYITEGMLVACDKDVTPGIQASDAACLRQYLLTGQDNSPLDYIMAVDPKIDYYFGDSIEDISIKRVYEDETVEPFVNTITELNAKYGKATVTVDDNADYTNLTVGTHTVKIKYAEEWVGGYYTNVTTTYDITVHNVIDSLIVEEKEAITYIEGQELDRSNYTVTAKYANGDTAIVTDYTTDKDGQKLKTSDKTVTFTYEGKTASADISVRQKQLTGISITKAPDKTSYIEGNSFDSTGMEVTAHYDNGDTQVVTSYNVIASDKLATTDTSVTVEYDSCTAEQPISVRAKQMTGIRITTPPDKTNYIEGNTFDTTGMVVVADYDNGDVANVADYTYPTDKLSVEQTSVEISYNNFKASQPISVRERQMTGIRIAQAPDKTEYIEGNTFDATGMIVEAVFDNDDIETITDYTVPADKLVLGQTDVTVSYNDFNATQPITVKARSITGIRVTTPPDKTTYVEGNIFDPTGMIVIADYDNGDVEEVSDYTVPSDKLVLEQTDVTVSYGEFTTKQPITVNAKSMTGIEIVKAPDKTNYIENTPFDSTGMIVEALYDNGDREPVNDYTTPSENVTLGQEDVDITYNGFSAKQPITVVAKQMTGIRITTPPTTTEYIENTLFDPTGMVVVADYDNGEVIEISDYTVPTDKVVLGQENVTVEYNKFTAEQPITVVAKSLVGISIVQAPDKVEYIENTPFDPAGMIVNAIYDNGETVEISDYIYPAENLTLGQEAVIISYQGFDARQAVSIRAKKLTGITIAKAPNKTEYIEGNTFDPAGMEVVASYDNGETAVITDYTTATTPFVLGDTKTPVEYHGFIAEQPIKVNAKSPVGFAIITPPTKTTYIEGNEFDPAGLEVEVTYDNGDKELVTDYTTPEGRLTLGDTTAPIKWGDFTVEQPITVVAKKLTGIAITVPPTKTSYVEGTDFDSTGMEVTGTYDNGDVEVIKNYTTSKGTLTLEDTAVDVLVDDFTATQTISVSTKTLKSITITTPPTKTTYTSGEEFDPTGMVVTGEYDNGDAEIITDYDFSKDALKTGTTEVIISTGDLTASQPVNVKAKSSGGGGSSSGGKYTYTNTGEASDRANTPNTEVEKKKDDKTGEGSGYGGTGVTPSTETQVADMFIDISNNYAREYINDLARKGILYGYADGTYRPTASTKRGDLACVLQRLMNLSAATDVNFRDVPVFSYYATAIGATTKADVMIGYGNGLFKPEKNVSREEMFVIIAKVSGVNTADISPLNKFNDSAYVADWAKPYAAALVNAGILHGDNGSLRPKDSITRAELAVLISQIAS